jgi:serine/threonine protein kinase
MTNMIDKNRNALNAGEILDGCYKIEKVLGAGGFGITYLAIDQQLNAQVAIKEFFPIELVVRDNSYTVHPISDTKINDFKWALNRFLEEARVLATFKHPNIVRVLRFFEANQTAYIVMEYEQGASLDVLIKDGQTATEAEIMKMLPPLLDGLETVHKGGYLHRDIKPGNIYLRDQDNTPVLIDFGAARYEIGTNSRSVTTIVTPGYAPFEQYETKGSKQGAWTDIYALGAVLYRIISGKIPIEAPERIGAIIRGNPDPLTPAVEIGKGKYSRQLLEAIDYALQINEDKRPQNVEQWRKKIFTETLIAANYSEPPTEPIDHHTISKPKVDDPVIPKPRFTSWIFILAGSIATILFIFVIIQMITGNKKNTNYTITPVNLSSSNQYQINPRGEETTQNRGGISNEEKERLRLEEERERLRLEEERERLRLEEERERLRLEKEKIEQLRRERERIRRERQEQERLRHERQEQERLRLEREKEIERLRLEREKEIERLRLEREKEIERLRRERQEQERIRREREKKFQSNLSIDRSKKFYYTGYKEPETPRTITKIILLDSYSRTINWTIKELKKHDVAYHYLIERDGNIKLLVEEKNIAFHTSKQNDDSIGIGIMHASKQNYPYDQKQSLIYLLKDIMSRHRVSKYSIYAKSQLDPRRKSEIIDILDDIREKL